MTHDERLALFGRDHKADVAVRSLYPDQHILTELINVLTPHPRGLRRWSVMQAIRKDRKRTSRDIPLKFEEEIERTFRRFCVDTGSTRTCIVKDAPFYRPRETAGEVWAIFPNCIGVPTDDALSGPSSHVE